MKPGDRLIVHCASGLFDVAAIDGRGQHSALAERVDTFEHACEIAFGTVPSDADVWESTEAWPEQVRRLAPYPCVECGRPSVAIVARHGGEVNVCLDHYPHHEPLPFRKLEPATRQPGQGERDIAALPGVDGAARFYGTEPPE